MAYRVVIIPRAENDLRASHKYIRKAAPEATRKWLKKMRQIIGNLKKFPERGRIAPESAALDEPIREVLYGRGNRGTYRILYSVTSDTVFVLHVRHGSRLVAEPSPGDWF